MTGVEIALLILVLVFGFFMAWNIGANDVANAMGTSVGSKALTLKKAVVLAAVFEFLGAYLVGGNVADTVRKGIFDPIVLETIYPAPGEAALILACGMIAALMAAGTWLMIASFFGWPVSTTHSIVGAVVGFGCVALGTSQIAWSKVTFIFVGWVVSPLLSGAVAYLLFRFILQKVFFRRDPVRAAKRIAPYLVFLVLIVLIGVVTFKGLKPFWKQHDIDPFDTKPLIIMCGLSLFLGLVGMFFTRHIVHDIKSAQDEGEGEPDELYSSATVSRGLTKATMHLRRVRDAAIGPINERAVALLEELEQLHGEIRDKVQYGTDSQELQKVERIFVFLQILTACFVAFSHGSNDVANAIGPLSGAFQAVMTGEVVMKSGVQGWALALGGTGIVLGLATWGWRVIRTVGERITELTPSRGFCAEFAAAITILAASILPIGLPISTTHTLVGAVLGVGLARGIGALNLTTMRDIVASWLITIPAGAILSIIFYFLIKTFVLDLGLFSR
ncbi:MAG: anion permease [Pirellulaceae bacterium]|nr:anion permease [Pirellulaceae bacterium]MDP6718439.1 anion permease [Pirellulaceae bacterium]